MLKTMLLEKNVTAPLDVLIETKKDGLYHGLDQYFNKIVIQSDEDLVGNWINIDSYEVREGENFARV